MATSPATLPQQIRVRTSDGSTWYFQPAAGVLLAEWAGAGDEFGRTDFFVYRHHVRPDLYVLVLRETTRPDPWVGPPSADWSGEMLDAADTVDLLISQGVQLPDELARWVATRDVASRAANAGPASVQVTTTDHAEGTSRRVRVDPATRPGYWRVTVEVFDADAGDFTEEVVLPAAAVAGWCQAKGITVPTLAAPEPVIERVIYQSPRLPLAIGTIDPVIAPPTPIQKPLTETAVDILTALAAAPNGLTAKGVALAINADPPYCRKLLSGFKSNGLVSHQTPVYRITPAGLAQVGM